MTYCEACGKRTTDGWEVQDRRDITEQSPSDLVVCNVCYMVGLLVQPYPSFIAFAKIHGGF